MKNFTHVKKKKNFYNGPVPRKFFSLRACKNSTQTKQFIFGGIGK
jgi:hypothetical protein